MMCNDIGCVESTDKNVKGSLSSCANPVFSAREKGAWEDAAKEKHSITVARINDPPGEAE